MYSCMCWHDEMKIHYEEEFVALKSNGEEEGISSKSKFVCSTITFKDTLWRDYCGKVTVLLMEIVHIDKR